MSLTAPGRDLLAKVNSARESAGSQHFAVLTEAERATLAELLTKLDDSERAP